MALAALVVAGLIPLVWPGDVPFINDEPQLIASAVRANREGRLAPVGLLGTYGFSYGPAPTWVYQALTPVTRDLVGIAALHILLMSAATAGGIWWLGRSLRLWIWFAPLPLLSPYYWFYARVLWDNPFLLPLGALALAGYAAFLASGSPTGLRVSVAAMLSVPARAPDGHLAGRAARGSHDDLPPARAVGAPIQPRGDRRRGVVAGLAVLDLPRRPAAGRTGRRPRHRRLALAPVRWPAAQRPRIGLLLRSRAGERTPVRHRRGDLVDRLRPGVVRHRGRHRADGSGLRDIVSGRRGRTLPRSRSARSCARRSSMASAAKFEHPHYHNGTWISSVLLAWFAVDFLATGPRAARWAATAATAASRRISPVRGRHAGRTPAPQPGHARHVRTDSREPAAGRPRAGEVPAGQRRAGARDHVAAVPSHARDPA